MLEDPELGPEFLLPLKMQGVQEIADSAIVIRCKFTAKPNKPTWVQREALKRIYRALQEAGVAFASNAVMVRSGSSERPSVKNRGSGVRDGADWRKIRCSRMIARVSLRAPDPASHITSSSQGSGSGKRETGKRHKPLRDKKINCETEAKPRLV